MKKFVTMVSLVLAAGFVVPAHAVTNDFLCGFTGFDYVHPAVPGGPPLPVPFLSDGDEYNAVGFVTSFSPLFAGQLSPTSEHTFYLTNAMAVYTVFSNNVLEVAFAPHARMRLYEDGANNGDYGTNPVNATSPSTFIDGTLMLGADVNNLILVFDYDTNQGNFQGEATLDEGSDLNLIPPGRRAGWVMSGTAGRPNATIPAGYVNQLAGEMQIPTVVAGEKTTWGHLKALYR